MSKELKKSLLEYIKVILVTVIITYIVLYFVQVSRVVGLSLIHIFFIDM